MITNRVSCFSDTVYMMCNVKLYFWPIVTHTFVSDNIFQVFPLGERIYERDTFLFVVFIFFLVGCFCTLRPTNDKMLNRWMWQNNMLYVLCRLYCQRFKQSRHVSSLLNFCVGSNTRLTLNAQIESGRYALLLLSCIVSRAFLPRVIFW